MKDLRGTWPQALGSLFLALLILLAIRWAFFEPYVIPSGSMIPTLLVHDHILVNKFAYGVRAPFTSTWLVHFHNPSRGDVVVFKSVQEDGIFLIKRVIGLPGDTVHVAPNGSLKINDLEIPRQEFSESEAAAVLEREAHVPSQPILNPSQMKAQLFSEMLPELKHFILQIPEREKSNEEASFVVPENHLFMMGDNRDQSADSRVWGFLPLDHVLGKAEFIWLACEETLPDANQVCDPHSMRWSRFFRGIK